MVVRVVTTADEAFALPAEVLDVGAMLAYGGGFNLAIPAEEWTTLEMPTQSFYWTSGHDSADLTFDAVDYSFTIAQTGLYFVHGFVDYNSVPAAGTGMSLKVNVDEMLKIGPPLQVDIYQPDPGEEPYLVIDQIACLLAGAVLTLQVYNDVALTTNGGQQWRVVRVG